MTRANLTFQSIEAALQQEDFPITKKDILLSIGDFVVDDDRGGTLTISQLMERIRRNRFDTVEEILKALEAAREAWITKLKGVESAA